LENTEGMMNKMSMKGMSLQRSREFWTYLHDQAELKIQAFISTPAGSSYKSEMRAEAETYQEISKKLSTNFAHPITNPSDIRHGLTEEQITGFLAYLDERTIALETALQETQRKRQEALAGLNDTEYFRARRIYKEMENLENCQISVFENARQTFMRILQER
jgi:hypothetical protein